MVIRVATDADAARQERVCLALGSPPERCRTRAGEEILNPALTDVEPCESCGWPVFAAEHDVGPIVVELSDARLPGPRQIRVRPHRCTPTASRIAWPTDTEETS